MLSASQSRRVKGASEIPCLIQTFLPPEEAERECCDGQLAGDLLRKLTYLGGGSARGTFWREALELRVLGGWLGARDGGRMRRGSGPAASCTSVETRSSADSPAQVCAHVRIFRFRLVVGAPTANWLANASVVNPGAIYRCRIGKNPDRTCEQLQLGELGLGPAMNDLPLVNSTVAQVLEKLMLPSTSSLK